MPHLKYPSMFGSSNTFNMIPVLSFKFPCFSYLYMNFILCELNIFYTIYMMMFSLDISLN